MPDGADGKTTANTRPDLKSRIVAIRDQYAAPCGRKPATKEDSAVWPCDMNAAGRDGAWGSDPAEIPG